MTEIVVATCADICSTLGGAFTCVSGGDAGGARSYLSGAQWLPQLRYL